MKTKKLVFFTLMCFAGIMMSCGGGDDEVTNNNNETPNNPSSQTEKKYGGIGVILTAAPGKWIAPIATGKASLAYGLPSTVRAFVRQDGKTYDAGTAFTKFDDSVISGNNVKYYSISMELPNALDFTNWWDVIVIANRDDARIDNGKVVCSGNLRRFAGDEPNPFVFVKGTDKLNTYSPVVHGQLAQAYEVLYLENKSDKEIIVRHKGFDAAPRWYYTEATICPEEKSVISGTISNEVVSDTLHIEPGGRKYFTSSYTPTGAKFTNVQFIAEIDGKEVRSTNRATADTEIAVDNCYFMYCYWDGKELTFRELTNN